MAMAIEFNMHAKIPELLKKRPSRVTLVLAIVFSTICAAQSVAAKTDRANRHYVVASSNNFPPVNQLDDDGELVGFGRDIAAAVIKAIGGTQTHIHSGIWTDVLKWLAEGRADFIHDTGYNEERTAFLEYSEPILTMPEEIFVRVDRFNINSLKSLKNAKVACVNKHTTHLYLMTLPGIECQIVPTPVDGLFALLNGDVDAFIFPRQILLHIAQQLNIIDRIKAVGDPIRELTWHMTVRKGDREMLDLLNEGIAITKANGQYDKIYDRWFGRIATPGYTQKELTVIVAIAVTLSLALGILIILVPYTFRIARTKNDLTETVLELERTQQALRESELRFRSLIENALDIITVIDSEGTITFESPSIQAILGYKPDELVGQNAFSLVHPDDAFVVQGAVRRLLQDPSNIEALEFRFRHKDGSWRLLGSIGRNLLENPAVQGIIVNSRDVTTRKAMEDQLRYSQKMDAVGQLTGGIAHDFNNILGIIMGFVEIVQDRVKDDPGLVKYLEIALDGTRRGAEITKKLLSFSRLEPSDTKITAVNDFIAGMRELISKSLTPSINVETHLANDLWPAEIDPGDFENAILNLSLNARDAMPEGGTLVVETANKFLDENYVKSNPLATVGNYVMIAVSDTGTGMTDEVKEKLFEPFFTTKDVGQGTGLGLSMVYGFVERSGGHIKVYSELGAGTTFRIYLPRSHEAAVDDETASDRQIELPRGNETILVVDDEEALLDVAILYLEKLGYNTLRANNGQQALEFLNGHQDIALLFCDVIMPGQLDGYRVALAAHKIRPALKILLASGFTKKREEYANGEGRYLNSLASKLLSKPYNSEELAFAVRRTLDDVHIQPVNPSMIVIDDDPDMANLISFTAQSLGIDVRIATNARVFMELYDKNEPSIIVMDVVIPDMDGIELLGWLTDKNCVAPIILMSGYGEKYIKPASHIASAKGIAIVGELTKPFQIEDLKTLLRNVLAAQQA